ncbi:hypothetical protein [Aquimarina algicola]|uniref:Uncharacterized protein n=1 Tax=Aquimarina algicola TaxID=2589995 RepID=A0A504JBC1_9FLAO|nr:hypothetical protein [Aquimarina algicola]TPN85822.1 hypothetical protein FHK87_11070 [Aquimarina algicola]
MEDHINITTDAQSKKIRLHFIKEVPTSLKTYLKRLGFVSNASVPNVFHARLATTYIQFATDLQQCLLGDCEYTAIPIIPSYTAEIASIASGHFSIATLTFMEQGISKTEKKLVFDPRRSVAIMIAEQYGKRMYGANFKSATAIPKNNRSGARKMLAQDDVILPEQQQIIAETPTTAQPVPQQLTNKNGVYTEETAKDRYERIDIPIPKTAKYEATIQIVHDENDQYRFAVSTQKNFGDYSDNSSPLSDRSTPYTTKNEALQLAFKEVITRIESQISVKDTILSNEDKKNNVLGKALQATIAYAKELGIEISDPKTQQQSTKKEQSKEETDTLIEMPISEVVSDTPSNESELTTIVQTVGEQLDALAIQSDVEKDKEIIQDVRNTFNEVLTTQKTNAFEKTVQEFLKRQEISLSKLNRLITQQQFIDLFTPLTDALSLPPLEIPTYPKYRIVQKWTQVKAELLERFQHLIDAKPDTLHFTYASSKDETTPPEALNVLKVTIESDRDMIGFLFEKETQSLIINTLRPNEENEVVYSGSAITTGKLSAAVSYMVAYPETVLIKPYTIAPYPSTQKEPDTPTSQTSKTVIRDYMNVATPPESIAEQEDISEAALDEQQDTDVRTLLVKKGFTIPFTGTEVYQQNRKVFDLHARWGDLQAQYETHIENDHQKRIEAFEKRLVTLKGKRDKESIALKTSLSEQITTLRSEIDALQEFLYEEQELFQKELYEALLKEVHQKAYTFTDEQFEVFRDTILEQLLEGRMIENYADQPVQKVASLLIEDFFYTADPPIKKGNALDYLDKVIAIMHDHYIEGRRLTKKQVEAVKSEAGVPNLGMLWEAVELSWLLWYKMLYQQPGSFEYKLQSMTAFWDEVQPGYAYSDSSKELYKQYSTPCPIGAIIAEYTDMVNAQKVFEPSAGNGLLVLGADPKKTHVNEIDNNRRASLEKQGFAKITYQNAAEPFPKQMTRAFDVMVTNPPFASWDAQVNEKKWIVSEFFNSYRRLDKNRLRLEHAMSGIALDTLKDSGKAALLLMGHIYFDDRGYIAKARPFFNWLYMHYHVDDVINLDGFTLYNKQGATPKTMLVLISGRKRKPTNRAIAPTRKQAGRLDVVVNTFEELWQRVQPHIKTPIDVLLQKLKIETNYDIL